MSSCAGAVLIFWYRSNFRICAANASTRSTFFTSPLSDDCYWGTVPLRSDTALDTDIPAHGFCVHAFSNPQIVISVTGSATVCSVILPWQHCLSLPTPNIWHLEYVILHGKTTAVWKG